MLNKEELFQHALEFFNANNHEEAEKICLQILKIDRFFANAYNVLSAIYGKRNDLDKAIQNVKHAININPNNHLYYINLGEFYNRKGDLIKAEEYSLRAIAINPDFSGSRYNLANIYKAQGKKAQAKQCYQDAITLNPYDWQSLQNLANLLKEEGANLEYVASFYFASIRINPANIDAEMALATCFYEMDNFYKAEFHYRSVLTMNPNNEQAIKFLAIIYFLQNRYNESLKYFKLYLQKDPKNIARMFQVDFLEPIINMSNKEIELDFKRKFKYIKKYLDMKLTLEKIGKDWFIENIQPNIQISYQGHNNKDYKIKYNQIFKDFFNEPTPNYKKTTDEPIKIGYFVTNGHEGIFARFIPQIINNIDKSFIQYIICEEKGYKEFIQEKIGRADVNVVFIDGKYQNLKDKVKPLELDILYHWEVGTDTLNYFAPSFKLAPVQVTSIGWPETTGNTDVDYFISSDLLEIENAQDHYTEKLVKFKNLPLINNKSNVPDAYFSFESVGIDVAKNTYLCSQKLKKLHPDYDIVVKKILEKDQNGLFIFIASEHFNVTESLRLRLKVSCAEVYERIFFIEKAECKSFNNYLGFVKQADVIVDSLYFGGATTTYDAFSMNTPIVTLPWDLQRGRYTKACYDIMEIEGLVAKDIEDLANIAVKIGTNKVYLNELKQKIEEKKDILFDNFNVIKEYEDFFTSCVKR